MKTKINLPGLLLWSLTMLQLAFSITLLLVYTPKSDILKSLADNFPTFKIYFVASIVIMIATCLAAAWQLYKKMSTMKAQIMLFILVLILPWIFGLYEVIRTGIFRNDNFFGSQSLLFYMGGNFAFIIASFWSSRSWVVKLMTCCLLLFPLPYVYQDLIAFLWLADYWSIIGWHVALGLFTALGALLLLRYLRTVPASTKENY